MNAIIINANTNNLPINLTSVEVAFVRLCASIKTSVKAKAKAVRTCTPSYIKAARKALARANARLNTRMIGVRRLIAKADSSTKREEITLLCNTKAKANKALKEEITRTGLSEATIKARKEQSTMAKLANVIRKDTPKKAKKAKTPKAMLKGIISVRATMEGTHAVDAKAKTKAVVNGGNTLVQDCTKEFMSFKSVLAAKKAQDILNKAKTRQEREARRLARIEAMKTLIGQVWMATGNWMDSDTMLEAANDMDYGVRKEAFAKMRALARGEVTAIGEAA